MTILTYIAVSAVILTFCVLGLSIGLLLKRRGHDITCPACENRGACKRK